jgi:hypothetical protein
LIFEAPCAGADLFRISYFHRQLRITPSFYATPLNVVPDYWRRIESNGGIFVHGNETFDFLKKMIIL